MANIYHSRFNTELAPNDQYFENLKKAIRAALVGVELDEKTSLQLEFDVLGVNDLDITGEAVDLDKKDGKTIRFYKKKIEVIVTDAVRTAVANKNEHTVRHVVKFIAAQVLQTDGFDTSKLLVDPMNGETEKVYFGL